jgi:hypothetical protein
MSTLNIDSLLASLETSAGIEKTASDNSVAKPNVSEQLSHVLEKKASEDLTKVAFAEGEKLAKELLKKIASNEIIEGNDKMVAEAAKVVPTETGGDISAPLEASIKEALKDGAKSDDLVDEIEDAAPEQTKEAQIKSENLEMAQSIMQKIAQIVGEETTTPAAEANIAGAAVPNLIHEGQAEMTAFDDAKVLPMPGQEGDLNTILEAVVARAQEQGAVSDDLINGDSPASQAESHAQVEEAQEKAAAVDALCQAGFDFESAVDMVKQAEYDLNVEAAEFEKAAAFDALTEAGVNFDDAVALIKQAEYEIEMEKVAKDEETHGKAMGRGGRMYGRGVLEATGGGLAGGLMGAGAGAIGGSKGALIGSTLGAGVGTIAGAAHGMTRSVRNQFKEETGKEGGSAIRAYGRGLLQGVAGGAAGSAIGHATRNPLLGAALGAASGLGGAVHGYGRSIQNQVKEHHKQAALEDLMAQGIDFDSAVEFVKEATETLALEDKSGTISNKMARAKNATGTAYSNLKRDASAFKQGGQFAGGSIRAAAAKSMAKNPLVYGTAAALAAGGAGLAAYKHHQKKAALEALVEAGIDFDSAVDMVKQAEYDVYGE